MSVSPVPAYTQPTSALEAFTKIFPSVFLTTSINGRHSSVTVLTKPKSFSQTTVYGKDERKVSVSFQQPMLSTTLSPESCFEGQVCLGMSGRASHMTRTTR